MRKFLVSLALLVAMATTSLASGPRKVTFDQSADCEFIAGWELAYEPVSVAGPLPSTGAFGVSIQNTNPLVCGLGANSIVSLAGVGNNRFWLRAVSADGSKSDYSNSLDAPIPFAAPVLVSVGS